MMNLFITGGNGEIGKSIANVFAQNGYNVIAPPSKQLDCSNNEAINSFFKNYEGSTVDAFVHCAGINFPKPFTAVTAESIFRSIQINTLSFLYITQQLNQYFNNNSRIAAISSIYGNISRVNRIEYTTSKNALKGMVQTLALELAPKGVLVNAVSPGFIETALTYKNNPSGVIQQLIADVPLKKLGKPEYVAELVHFLCSDKNNFITGQDIIIDGGYLTGGFQS